MSKTTDKQQIERLTRENAALLERLKLARATRTQSQLASVFRRLITVGFPSYFGYKAVVATVGKVTKYEAYVDAKLSAAFGAGSEAAAECSAAANALSLWNIWAIVFLLGFSIAVWIIRRHRALRVTYIQRIAELTKQLELGVTPNRSTSGISRDGTTAPAEDL